MQLRVVTLRYNEAQQGFPEEALRAATFGREVLSASEHFFVHGNVPHLALLLLLGDAPGMERMPYYRGREPNAPDPEEGMTDAQKTCYRALKAWRNETAKSEGCLSKKCGPTLVGRALRASRMEGWNGSLGELAPPAWQQKNDYIFLKTDQALRAGRRKPMPARLGTVRPTEKLTGEEGR